MAAIAGISVLSMLIPAPVQAAPQLAPPAARTSLPSDRLHFGLASGPGTGLDWMVSSGVPWRYRYQYLAGGINTANNSTDPCAANAGWQTWNSPAGQFVTDYINASAAHSYVPVFTYYEIVQSNPSQGNESAELTKISTVCTMQAYWADFTVLMQKVGAYGGQVVVHVEPDFWGFMEQQSADPTTIPAVVASSGNADLAGLPNTVAGMGLAFLKLRDKYAPNALLGIHASSWGSGVDIATDHRTTVDPNVQADAVAAFLNKAGIVGNPGGITPWDLVFNDVADHDAGWYGALTNDHWWDRNNSVFPNFTRWLAFMSRLHTDTALPLVEWQVPVGNQYFDTMNNTDGHYQDNRAEYFIAHPDLLTASGIVAVLFGAGNAGQTSYMDAKSDGVTNPAAVSSWQCNACNNHPSTVADDDGGFLRMAVGAYYRSLPGTSCRMFPSDSVFNTDISALPVNAQSQAWTGNMTQAASLHPDLGTFAQQYGIPINVAPPPSTGLAPAFGTSTESDHPTEGYPIDQSTFIEGGPSAPAGSDRHALVVNKNSCKLYEIYNLQNFTNGQTPVAGSGAVWDLGSNAMRPAGWTSADAAGLPIAPLLLRPDEIQAGTIAHAIRLTAHCTSTYIWPASHQAGSCSTGFPPMGARFRLRSTFDISTFAPATQVVLRAFQHYGLILADNGADWYFQGTTDDWWGTTAGSQVVSELKTIPASQFDAIDEAGLQGAAGSYQASGPTPCATPTLTANPPSQRSAGGTVLLTASTSGCVSPQYRFWVRPASGSWTMVQDYGGPNTFTWTPTTPGSYYLGVHVRALGSSAPYESVAAIPYTVTSTACTALTLSAAPSSPQNAGASITVTAAATCPGASPQYQFVALWAGTSTWIVQKSYTNSTTWTWNSTGAPAGIEHFGVWVKDAGSSNVYDQVASIPFTITNPACTAVSLSAAPASPSPSGTTITVTATGTCPSANPRYEYWALWAGTNGWILQKAYSTSPTWTWNSTGAPPGTERFGVWVRDANSSAPYDAINSIPFQVT
jgi:hypothetical protein